MQFRHPDGVRLSTTDGHVALVGDEWRELPQVLHQAAMAAGCECDTTRFRAEAPKVESSPEAAARPSDHDDVIRTALTTMLSRDEEGDFTRDNLPNVNVVAKLAGMGLRKEDVLRVFRTLQSEAAGAADGAE